MTINSTLGPNGYEVSIPAPVSGGGADVAAKYQGPALVMAAIGDSRFANALQIQSTATVDNVNWSNQGALFWLNFLTFQALNLPPEMVFAVSGSTTAQIREQADTVVALATKPDICFINGGTNSFSAVATLAQVQQSLTDITGAATALRDVGIIPVIEVDYPRTVASWNTTAQDCSIEYNRRLREWCSRNRVRCVDTELDAVQWSGTLGDPVSGYNVADGVHNAQPGAIVRAYGIRRDISDLLAGYRAGSSNPLDLYDASVQVRGNLLANGFMDGTSGSNSGTGASGTVPTGWTNQIVSGTATCVCSIESTRTDGRSGKRAVLTINATTETLIRFAPPAASTASMGLASADVVFGEIDAELTTLTSGAIEAIHLNCFDWNGSANGATSLAGKNTFASGLNQFTTLPIVSNRGATLMTTLAGRLKSAPIEIGQNGASANVYFRPEIKVAAGTQCVVKLGDATLRKVVA